MKKLILIPALAFIVAFAACGPAAENREQMHARAKVFQDSIANAIRVSFAEAEAPGRQQVVMPQQQPATTAATAAAQPQQPAGNMSVNKAK